MNASQMKYALARVDAIAKERIKKLQEQEQAAQKVANDAAIKKLVAGELKVKKKLKEITPYSYLCDVFEFPTKMGNTRYAPSEAQKAITAQVTAIKDRIMLGDEASALRELEEFSKGTL